MKRTGYSDLPLHRGHAPPWLVKRMIKLATAIVKIIVDEFGTHEFLNRLANPFWFQAFSCVLGYDWHSSGTTTVTTGVLKIVLNKNNDIGLFVAGGKGSTSLKTPNELKVLVNRFEFSDDEVLNFVKLSRLIAKVDSAVLQDGFNLYHHTFIIDKERNWVVIQQGMDLNSRFARRYHWKSSPYLNIINEPHEGIATEIQRDFVLDLTARKSSETRKAILDLINDNLRDLEIAFLKLKDPSQKLLIDDLPNTAYLNKLVDISRIPYLKMPRKINWSVIKQAKRLSISDFKDLLILEGFGPALLRSLALVSHIIWGTSISWIDPAKFSFAHGGKDGVPYPVDIKLMEQTYSVLEDAIQKAKIGKKEKIYAIKRLNHVFSF
ncbi:MAG: DUF763 domain-containing protein [Candidatus Asgardarchaeia archaeon]